MLKIYVHLFYRIYWWHLKILKETEEGTAAARSAIGMSIFPVFNIFSILNIIVLCNDLPTTHSVYIDLAIMAVVAIINYICFATSGTYKEIAADSAALTKKQRRKLDILALLYIILTFVVLILTTKPIRELNAIHLP